MTTTHESISTQTLAAVVHGPDTQPRPRPYWLAGPCPPWCENSDTHSDRDSPDERLHFSISAVVTLVLEEPRAWESRADKDGPLERCAGPSELRFYLQQHFRDHEPCIGLSHDDKPEIYLTLAEARELAGELLALVDAANARGDAG